MAKFLIWVFGPSDEGGRAEGQVVVLSRPGPSHKFWPVARRVRENLPFHGKLRNGMLHNFLRLPGRTSWTSRT